jgi:Zn-finger nucleic acid-binding protein
VECPRCTQELVEKGGAHDLQVCPQGHGRFLDSGEARALLEERLQLSPHFLKELAEQFQTVKPLTCMGCGGAMRMFQLKGAWVDVCFSCGGLWLDTGELSLLDPTVELEEGLTDLYNPEHESATLPVVKGQVLKAHSGLATWHDAQGRPGHRERTWIWTVPLSLLGVGFMLFISSFNERGSNLNDPFGLFMVAATLFGINAVVSHQTETLFDAAKKLLRVKYRALWKWKEVKIPLDEVDHISALRYLQRNRYGTYEVYRVEATTTLGEQIPLALYKSRRRTKVRRLADRLDRLLKLVQADHGAENPK